VANNVEVRLSDEAMDNLIAKTLDLAIKQFSSQDAKAKWTGQLPCPNGRGLPRWMQRKS
jgi:hypothetical protein